MYTFFSYQGLDLSSEQRPLQPVPDVAVTNLGGQSLGNEGQQPGIPDTSLITTPQVTLGIADLKQRQPTRQPTQPQRPQQPLSRPTSPAFNRPSFAAQPSPTSPAFNR